MPRYQVERPVTLYGGELNLTDVQAVARSLGLRVVAAGERPEWPRFVHHRHAGFGRRVAGVVVVVAAH